MHFRFLLLLLPVLLGSCANDPTPAVQVDFIGTTALTSSNRVVNPNDSLTTRLYAAGNNGPLKRLRITVNYEPGPVPFVYPTPLNSFDPDNAPDPQTFVYLDSLIIPITRNSRYTSPYAGGEYVFENRFSARSTSGTELWQYTVSDGSSPAASTTRGYRLTARKPDSAAVFHSFTTAIRPLPRTPLPTDSARNQARVFLNLRYGLLLPKYALLNNEATLQANQPLVDLVCLVTSAGTGVSLNSPADDATVKLSAQAWPTGNRRRTLLRLTTLTPTQFTQAVTTASFAAAYAAGTTTAALSTGPLAKEAVWAFQTTEGTATYTGLLLVSDLITGTAPVLRLSVKVQK